MNGCRVDAQLRPDLDLNHYYLILVPDGMERRAWTPQEDQVLKNLYEKVKVNKWSLIANMMQEQYSLPPRTGKQCRQRYNNHLNPFFAKVDWTREEEDKLFSLHNELGNKWAIIATKLGGRTDNGVKNHFFAKLRKSMRKINRLIQKHFKQKLKELKINVLYKIVQASEERFKKKPMCEAEKSQFSCHLKNEILKFVYERPEEEELLHFKALIEQIHHFAKTYRRRPKQLRRISDKQSSFSQQNEPLSDHSQLSSDRQDSQDEIIRFSGQFQGFMRPCKEDEKQIRRELRSKVSKVVPSEIEEVPNNQPQPVLKGLLVDQQEYPLLLPPPNLMKRQSNSEIMGDSIKNQQFFEESAMHCSIPPLMFSSQLKKSNEDEFFKH